MNHSKIIYFVFAAYSLVLLSCSEESIEIRLKTDKDYFVTIDTIRSVHRFTDYYPRKYTSVITDERIELNPGGKTAELIEVSWFRNNPLYTNQKLIYKTDIQHSVFLFPDKPGKMTIDPSSGIVKSEDISEKNRVFLQFQKDLKNIYKKRTEIENWADSIKNQPGNDSIKSYVYNTYKKEMESIDKLRDSLASFAEEIEFKGVKLLASVMVNSLIKGDLKTYPEKIDTTIRLDKQLVRSIKNYRKFQNHPESNKIPSFQHYTVEGNVFNLSEERGKVTIFNFWASYCGPCLKKSNTLLKPLYKKYHDKGLEIIGVSLDKDTERWKKTVAERGYPWIDINCSESYSPFRDLFNVRDIPALILIDKEGKVIARNPDKAELVNILNKHLDDKK